MRSPCRERGWRAGPAFAIMGRMNRGNLLNAPLADGVRRVGFRKWYERELLSSHAHMVLAFLAMIALLGSFEAMRGAALGDQLLNLLGVLASASIGIWALRRYLFLLMRAEDVANQASCGDCGTYGRFRVVGEHPQSQETLVCCLKCQHNWTISVEP
jgi:hypothetical protein